MSTYSNPKPLTRLEICQRAGAASAAKKRAKRAEIRGQILEACVNDPELAQLSRAQFHRMLKAAVRVSEADQALQRATAAVEVQA